MPYCPLGRGFLSGTIPTRDALVEDDRRRAHPRYQDENMAKNSRLLEALGAVARDAGASPAQVAIAWLLARGPDLVPIPGTKKVKWLDENIAAVDLALSDGQMAALEEAFPPGAAAGERYPESDLKRVNL